MRKREPFEPHVHFREQKKETGIAILSDDTPDEVYEWSFCTETCLRLLAVGGNMIKCTQSSEAISAHICVASRIWSHDRSEGNVIYCMKGQVQTEEKEYIIQVK